MHRFHFLQPLQPTTITFICHARQWFNSRYLSRRPMGRLRWPHEQQQQQQQQVIYSEMDKVSQMGRITVTIYHGRAGATSKRPADCLLVAIESRRPIVCGWATQVNRQANKRVASFASVSGQLEPVRRSAGLSWRLSWQEPPSSRLRHPKRIRRRPSGDSFEWKN